MADLDEFKKKNKDLEEQLAIYKALQTAKWLLEMERAVKRAREG